MALQRIGSLRWRLVHAIRQIWKVFTMVLYNVPEGLLAGTAEARLSPIDAVVA